MYLSYDEQDAEKIALIVRELEQAGYRVYCDLNLPVGAAWHHVVDFTLSNSDAVVVAWSSASARSTRVVEEARFAVNNGLYVPIVLDRGAQPHGFEQNSVIDFVDWDGSGKALQFRHLLNRIQHTVASTTSLSGRSALDGSGGPESIHAKAERQRKRLLWQMIIVVIVIASVGVEMKYFGWRHLRGGVQGISWESDDPRVFQDSLKVGGQGPEMVMIPAGVFSMGSPTDEYGREGDEGPPREVKLQAFALSRDEITFDQFNVFARATNHWLPRDERWGSGNRPIVEIGWHDAQDYARWLSEQTGENYRLPSEAEWEYAARAKSATRYWWGDEIRPGNQAMANCSMCGSPFDRRQSAPSGMFERNPFGLRNMNGNVWEWTTDCWHESYKDAPRDATPWLETDEGECSVRVVRGGSFGDDSSALRSANRHWAIIDQRIFVLGMRLARDL